MATVTGVHQVVFALREHGQDMERGTQAELHRLAGMVANTMKRLANKRDDNKIPGGMGTLVQSIKPDRIDANTWDIGPHVDHAYYLENGVKPGGKGLPKYLGDAGDSHQILNWLRSAAFSGVHKPRKGSKALQSQDRELRDRYFGLARHIRGSGVKAHPFVEPTAKEMEPVVLKRLDLAVRRVLAARGGSGAVTA